jgi:hypothetical protein
VKAGQLMPDDPVAQRNCGLIRMVEEAVTRARQNLAPMLAAMFGSLQVRRK